MSQPFLIFGHRGSPGRYPENTLSSFDEALRAGADGFETDLRLLSDKTAVLFHDDELAEEEIESLSLDESSKRGVQITRLKDLARYAGRTTMVLEVKRAKWEDALLAEIEKWPNIIVASFDHSTIAELARRKVSFPLGITTYGHIVDIGRYAASVGASWCFPGYHYVDADMVRSLHDRDIKVVPYTPNRAREWQRLRDIGCDGVITDVPHEAVSWRDS
jgi:glycerophosphoryl diester phosphodiesterase